MPERNRRRLTAATIALASLISFLNCFTPARADVEKDDQPNLVKDLPIYCWQDSEKAPTAIVIAVHGLTMHGGVFDAMARNLAARGAVVYAPDMRGYGRWLQDDQYKKEVKDPNQLNYEQSYQDLLSIIKSTKSKYPGLPLFCIGESLGADIVLRAAGETPDQIDGLILSSPAIKHSHFLIPLMAHTGEFLLNPHRKVDLVPYIKKLASEDPQIVEAAVEDPLVRKHLTAYELFQTCNAVKPALDYAKKVPTNMPVLVIQGGADRMVRSNAVVLLLEQMKSSDQTVRWFSNRGHLLLETSYIKTDTLETVDGWLETHIKKSTEVANSTRQTIGTSEKSAIVQAKFTETDLAPTD